MWVCEGYVGGCWVCGCVMGMWVVLGMWVCKGVRACMGVVPYPSISV